MEGSEERLLHIYLSWLQHHARPTDDHSVDVGLDSPCAPIPGEILYWIKVEAISEKAMILLEEPGSARSWQNLLEALDLSSEDYVPHHLLTCSLAWPNLVIPVNSDWDCRMLFTKLLPNFCGMLIIDTSYGPQEEDNLAFLGRAKNVAVLPYAEPMQHIFLADKSFQHFTELTSLYIAGSNYEAITDQAFSYMTKLSEVNMRGCNQSTITDDAFTHLPNLTRLDMSECDQQMLTDTGFGRLTELRHLSMAHCTQSTLTDKAFEHLSELTHLDMHGCSQSCITDQAFMNLQNLRVLDMGGCDQGSISDLAFIYLKDLRALYMDGCTQSEITNGAFEHLRLLTFLDITSCRQPTISADIFEHLPRLHTIELQNSCVDPASAPTAVHVRGEVGS